jgi:hypothetical protein
LNVHGIPFRNLYGVPRNAAECSLEYSEQFRGNTEDYAKGNHFSLKFRLQKGIPVNTLSPILFGREEIFFLPMVITISGCIQRKTWCMDPYDGVDYNSPYLTVNSVVSYSPPLQRDRGGVGKISPIS